MSSNKGGRPTNDGFVPTTRPGGIGNGQTSYKPTTQEVQTPPPPKK